MADFTLNVQLNSDGTVTSDHPGQKLTLYSGDNLIVSRGTGWTRADGITEIVFYDSANPLTSSYDRITANSPSVATWSPGGNSNLDGHFTTSSVASSGVTTSVTLADAQQNSNVDWFYVVKIGGKQLDPEVINKSGQSTSVTPSGWSN